MLTFPDEPRLIGPALKNLRQMLGVTQMELVAAGVGNQGVISALENGHVSPMLVTVMAYLRALDLQLCAKGRESNERQQSETTTTEVAPVLGQDQVDAPN